MTKRITAFLLAILMVLSAFLMTSCKKDQEDENSEEEKIVVENLSAKELFALSIKNTLTGGKEINTSAANSEGEVSVKFDLNKLEVEGEDILQGEKIGAEIAAKVDIDNKAVELEALVNALGEKPSIKAIVDTNGVYVTDLLGVNNKTLGMTFEDLDIDTSVIGEIFNDESMKAATELYNDIAKALDSALDKNVTDSAYTKEMKDVTVDGKEYKGAAVATLTVTSEMAKNFVYDFITSLTANQYISDMLQEMGMDAGDISDEIEFDGSVKITNTVSADAETIALDIDATIEGETLAIKYTNIGTSVKITAGLIGENGEFDVEQGVLKIVYTLDGENEKLVVGFTEGEETTEPLVIEGTYKNGKHEGILKIKSSTYEESYDDSGDYSFDEVEQTIGIKYALEGDMVNSIKLTVSEFSMTQNSVTTTIPMNIVIESKVTGTKTDTKIAVALELEGIINIDVAMEMSVNFKSVTVTAPKDYMGIDEITEDTAMDWMTKLENKYPKIIEFISEMGNSSAPDTVYPDYDYDYDYDYGYDEF